MPIRPTHPSPRPRRTGRCCALLALLLALTGCQPLATGAVQTALAPVASVIAAPFPTAPIQATRVPLPTATPARAATATRAIPPGATAATLVKVIDGDTIDVSIGGVTERVRYVGVDTPERNQPGFKAATEANRQLLGTGPLYLVRDVSDRDKTSSHRLLRYVYRSDGALVEAELVAGGWAQPVEYPPDTRFAAEFRQVAVQAAHAGRGFWSAAAPAGGAMPYGLTIAAADVRKGPGPAFGLTVRLSPDTPLTVYGRTSVGDWLQVRTPERKGGWISAASARLNVPLDQVPVSEKIPTPEG